MSTDHLSNDTPASAAPAPPHQLFTFRSGGWVLLLAAFFTLVAAALVLYPVYATGFHRAIGDGRNVDTYLFDLSNLTLSREQLLASGYAKDQIRAVPESLVETDNPEQIDLIAKNEHIKFLVPSDLVVGVVLNGQVRAYPVRLLNVHELVNDRLGGQAIAITWSPLCGSAVAFDRAVDGSGSAPVEFGVSGLLYQSNLIYFDRRSRAQDESLWPQLAFKAIAGPRAGKAARIVPCEVASWGDWRAAHPDTRVFLGLRTLKRQYGAAQDPINLYLADDDLKFPVKPYWNVPNVPRKTRILVTSPDGEHWIASPDWKSPPTATPSPYRISTFLFAWYAQHSADTDYSVFGIPSKAVEPTR
jgi:hypothetical protein